MTKPWLHIHTDCPRAGGSENMPFNFLRSPLVRREFEVTFSYRWSREYKEGMEKWLPREYRMGVHITPIHFPAGWVDRMGKRWTPLKALRYPAMLYEVALFADMFRRDRPDILHVNNGGYPGATSCNAAAMAARLAGVPMITYAVNSTARDLWWERPITWLMRRSVTRFVSASENLMRNSRHLWKREYWDMAQGSGLDDSNWRIIPNTIFYKEPADPAEVRSRLGVNGNAFMFVVAGADELRKGREVFTKALFKIGNTEGIKPGEDVVGWMSDPDDNRGYGDHDLINAADCLVVPSLYDEDFPNVILIAMMYGKPVLASDLGGIREMLTGTPYYGHRVGESQRCGMLLNLLGDVNELFGAMLFAKSHKDLMREWGENGRRRFGLLYSEHNVMSEYVGLWKGVS